MVVGTDASRARRLGRRAPSRSRPSGRCRGSASTSAARSTATATTTGGRSTWPRGSARGRPAARCWSRARSREAAGRHLAFQPIGEVKLKGFGEATELFLARRAVMTGCRSWSCCSGGRDSVCLLDLAVRRRRPRCRRCTSTTGCAAPSPTPTRRSARRCARGSASSCSSCTPERRRGNVQAWARDVRYAEAERLAAERDALIAVGHTATDQVETVLYRLAASPGRRALLGMPERSGRIVRPLLALTREQTAAYCRARGLAWREDATNAVVRARADPLDDPPGAARAASGGGGEPAAHAGAAARRGRGARRGRRRRAADERRPDAGAVVSSRRSRPRWRGS